MTKEEIIQAIKEMTVLELKQDIFKENAPKKEKNSKIDDK